MYCHPLFPHTTTKDQYNRYKMRHGMQFVNYNQSSSNCFCIDYVIIHMYVEELIW